MTVMNTADKIAWAVVLTVFAAIVGADILSHAGVIPAVSKRTANTASIGLMSVILGFLIWAATAAAPAPHRGERKFGGFDWFVFLVAFTPLGLHAAKGIANGFFDANWAPMVSSKLILTSAMLFMAWSIWLNRKYPRTVEE